METLLLKYLIPTGIAILLFYSFYHFVLQRGTSFKIQRYFLLATLLFSFLLPFIEIRYVLSEEQFIYSILGNQAINSPMHINNEGAASSWGILTISMLIYIAGILFLSIRFFVRITYILLLALKFGIHRRNGHRIVFMQNKLSHFSFFNLIFLNRNTLHANEESKVITHETAHIKQHHFIDLLIVEIASILQWFNPMIWIYKRGLKNVHEYLADQATLKTGVNKAEYCQLLLKQATGVQFKYLSNSFYYPPLKKRIIMITKADNRKQGILKLCFALPIFALLLFTFSCTPKNKFASHKPDIERMPNSTREKYKDFLTEPDQSAVYKNGDQDIATYFISILNFDQNWKSKITDKSTVELTFFIDETGKVIDAAQTFINQGIYVDTDFPNRYRHMGNWKPAMKDGKAIKSTYVYNSEDILRKALKANGKKVYTVKEFAKEIK